MEDHLSVSVAHFSTDIYIFAHVCTHSHTHAHTVCQCLGSMLKSCVIIISLISTFCLCFVMRFSC
uniref:Uncharacterized protein n=1 Tax=Mastacembelus armatus TaxID=205130 RepID=A0A3Q3MBL2_9TELE